MINCLNWRDRPPEVIKAINSSFNELSSRTNSTWGMFNGAEGYQLCEINERHLIRQMILHAPQGQKEFTIIDLGAGNFQWAHAVAEFLQSDTSLPKDTRLNIISTRGEKYLGDRVIEIGQCTLYNLGAFKVEELVLQLQEQGFFLTGQVDLCLSRWCMIHLVDPLGTLLQVLELLRCDGWCLMDGFFTLDAHQSFPHRKWLSYEIAQILAATNSAFLIHPDLPARSSNAFVLRKLEDCQLPMSYAGVQAFEPDHVNGSGYITKFHKTKERSIAPTDWCREELIGDKWLFNTLREWDGVIMDKKWRSLLEEKDQPIEVLGINDIDGEGCTALLLAVRAGNLEQVQLLIEQGANIKIPNYQGLTPLHEAVLADFQGDLIQTLLTAGTTSTSYNFCELQPLLKRIQEKFGNVDVEDDLWFVSPLQLARLVNNELAIALINQSNRRIPGK